MVSPLLISPSLIPDLFAGGGVERDRMNVERVENDFSVGIGGAAIDHITACDTLRGSRGLGLIFPLDRCPRLAQVQRVHDVWKGCDDIHGGTYHKRRRLMAAVGAGRERPGELKLFYVFSSDLIERAESRAGEVLGRANPLPIL